MLFLIGVLHWKMTADRHRPKNKNRRFKNIICEEAEGTGLFGFAPPHKKKVNGTVMSSYFLSSIGKINPLN